MSDFVIALKDVDKRNLGIVGGKGANLGELAGIENLLVPNGFCVTTIAYKNIIEQAPLVNVLLEKLSLLKANEHDEINTLSNEIRNLVEAIIIPARIIEEIEKYLTTFKEDEAFAIRSSATAEDMPTASFAGQQDTYLNIIGKASILKHISKCWASLFTERAVTYRIQNGFDHRKVQLAVVVQQMIFPDVSGIMFTADPLTANRKIISIDASFGLGEALVSGLVNADIYKVMQGKITGKKISNKQLAIYAVKEGGTKELTLSENQQNQQALNNEQIIQLEQLGRKIEAHFGNPQDIEWCLANNFFYFVQSRPITTLYPLPEASDKENHLYVSVGHQQMMTDAMKPLGISLWQLTATRAMHTAGGRLFVDITEDLASPQRRNILLNVLGKSDPLVRYALTRILDRGDFIKTQPVNEIQPTLNLQATPFPDYQALKDYDPSIVTTLIKRSEEDILKLDEAIATKTGTALIDFILEDMQQSKKKLADPQSFGVIMTGMNASTWLNDKIYEWLGEKNVADTLTQSAPNNITSEMGLALLDVADVIRPYHGVVEYLEKVKDDNFLQQLYAIKGGEEAKKAIIDFLDKFGMRCAGEIDITRTRWAESPATLLPVILTNIRNFKPGESKRKFKHGLQESFKKEKELLERLKQLPDGEQKASETKRMIDLVRNLVGYREYPKYGMVRRYYVYKKVLMKEAACLVQSNVLNDKEDIYYVDFNELREIIHTQKADYQFINQRKETYNAYKKLSPPRVLTSDGEIITAQYKRENLPTNAIVGLAVSSGIIEGRARVILKMQEADLQYGDILVTAFTDPSWTPLFVSIKGLVTEVGGLMTHGSVIAREYGLPAVVGINNATKIIKDGQLIRVNGTDGYIEIL